MSDHENGHAKSGNCAADVQAVCAAFSSLGFRLAESWIIWSICSATLAFRSANRAKFTPTAALRPLTIAIFPWLIQFSQIYVVQIVCNALGVAHLYSLFDCCFLFHEQSRSTKYLLHVEPIKSLVAKSLKFVFLSPKQHKIIHGTNK